jgi:uncharacterized membrane protein YphA (DoxX/SURF4 family)
VNINTFTPVLKIHMTIQTSKTIHITLWVAQIVLASLFAWAGMTKLLQSVEELSAMWPWTGQVPVALVKLTGILDLSAAIGLIVPSLFRLKPVLTPMAAIGIIALMVCAAIFHIARGEASGIGVNIVCAAIATFIAWGRLKKAPVTSK